MAKKIACVIGSGAGAGPIIYELSKAGFQVIVLEKGPWFETKDFSKDEIALTRRSVVTPNLMDEPQVLEKKDHKNQWVAKSNFDTGNDFWNGSCVGGSSNFMSGYFHRMKEMDFKLLSKYGPIEGSNVVDWPIDYNDMEPYFDKVEKIVGVSGRLVNHKYQEPRSQPKFPFPPLAENIVSEWIDKAAGELGYTMIPVPRAILSQASEKRMPCYYSNYCGSYGCSSDAKGSSRAALINIALETGNCKVTPNAKVFHLKTNGKGKVVEAHYHDIDGGNHVIKADIFVVAAQAIESSRLLLMSKNEDFPNGLANNNGQVGKNLIFSAGGIGSGYLHYKDLTDNDAKKLSIPGVFVNRGLHHFYEIPQEDGTMTKGGSVDFLFEHANPIGRSIRRKWNADGDLVYGSALKKKIYHYFNDLRRLKFEIFVDWQPNDDCFVSLDPEVKDKWGDPVARIRLGHHKHDLKVGEYIAEKCEEILEIMGAKNISSNINGSAPSNLQAGGCRFGKDPKNSVLDINCKAHEVDNLYVSDGSFMPTGGSVTYTWTIYANAFRVADAIIKRFNI
ncbi:MAG: GMC family oxidoreductase [Bacteroidales bacterium]|nr:GMC family oxidoreductase [Bacteroidales bacterium]